MYNVIYTQYHPPTHSPTPRPQHPPPQTKPKTQPGTSAIWAAQRVPDGHISLVANQFVIRGVKNHPDFMCSENLWDAAQRNGLWSPDQGEEGGLLCCWEGGLLRGDGGRRVCVLCGGCPTVAVRASTDPPSPPPHPPPYQPNPTQQTNPTPNPKPIQQQPNKFPPTKQNH